MNKLMTMTREDVRKEILAAELEKWEAVEDAAFEKLMEFRMARRIVRFNQQKFRCRELSAIVVEIRDELERMGSK